MTDDATQAFYEEATELLEDMESALLQMEEAPDDENFINQIFRAAHTIKGTGGVFGFDDVESFTHVVENVLERIRAGNLAVDDTIIALLLKCRDHIQRLVDNAVNSRSISEEDKTIGLDLKSQLVAYLDEDKKVKLQEEKPSDDEQRSTGEEKTWSVNAVFSDEVLENGMDPISFIRYLNKIGTVEDIRLNMERFPTANDYNPEKNYVSYALRVSSSQASKEDIEATFDFVKEDCELKVEEQKKSGLLNINSAEVLPEDKFALGDILCDRGIISQEQLNIALEEQQRLKRDLGDEYAPRLGEILVSKKIVTQEIIEAALKKQTSARSEKVKTSRQLRVDADKLDSFINLVGELVIAGATTNLLAQRFGDSQLIESVSSVLHLVEDIRDSALRLRMVQIGDTFNRYQRVVRDVSKELGKDIVLNVQGGETELDKTMVEKLSDPLLHLVRNAVDHGIESEVERATIGKPRQGTLTLNAYHDSGSIVIQVKDDGKGLNKEKIIRKAIERGIISHDHNLSKREIFHLIFEPGFSTADTVTNLSGRGVGMDVVKRNIESLRGVIDVESEENVGTTISIRLPLTLSIIDGFLVGVGNSSYVIPLDMVLECIELSEDEDITVNNNYINLRGKVLPFLRLNQMFGEQKRPNARENIVVVQVAGQTAGFVVEELMGEFQTVIKPLGKLFEKVPGISGATILGSGEVAVILDVPGLVSYAISNNKQFEQPFVERDNNTQQISLH